MLTSAAGRERFSQFISIQAPLEYLNIAFCRLENWHYKGNSILCLATFCFRQCLRKTYQKSWNQVKSFLLYPHLPSVASGPRISAESSAASSAAACTNVGEESGDVPQPTLLATFAQIAGV